VLIFIQTFQRDIRHGHKICYSLRASKRLIHHCLAVLPERITDDDDDEDMKDWTCLSVAQCIQPATDNRRLSPYDSLATYGAIQICVD